MHVYPRVSVFISWASTRSVAQNGSTAQPSHACSETLNDSRCVNLRDLSLPTTCFYQLQLLHKTTRSDTSAGQGPSPSGNLALKMPDSSVRLMLTGPPLYWFLHWSRSTRPICLSLSIQKISYHVSVRIIIPLTQYLSCILFCVSVMSGDSARSHVFCCARGHIVRCCVYQSESGAVCDPKAALFRRVGLRVQGRPWASHCTKWTTCTCSNVSLMIKCIMVWFLWADYLCQCCVCFTSVCLCWCMAGQ